MMDEIRIYNRALTAPEIQSIYAAGSNYTYNTRNNFTFVWTNAPTGSNSLTAVATDNDGLTKTSAPPTVVITVNNSLFTVQITSPINQILLARSNVIITATATNTTPGVTNIWVEFFANATNSLGFAVTATNGFYQLNWIPPTGGTIILTALAMDSQTNTAWSAPVTNYVRNLPIVTITSPTNGQVFPVYPTNITLSATAVADLATITNVLFYQGTNIVGATNVGSPYYTVTWIVTNNGTYTLYAQATDSTGATGTSFPVPIIVEPANQPPSVYAGPDQTNNLSTNALQLIGLVSDDGLPLGSTLMVNWTNLSGGTNAVLTITNLPATSVYFYATGVYQFRLSASDGQYTNYSTNTITVLPANLPPVVHAGPDQTIVWPAFGTTNLMLQLTSNAIVGLSGLRGIDYLATSNAIVVAHVSDQTSPTPNFDIVSPVDRSATPYSPVNWLDYEPQLATVRDTLGGFKVGELFTGGENPGEIIRVGSDGSVIGTNGVDGNAWVVITNESANWYEGNGVICGLCVDRTGVFGGDLIVAPERSCWIHTKPADDSVTFVPIC